MSYPVTALILATTGEEFSGVLTGLASSMSPDGVTWTATSASPSQFGRSGIVQVVLTDAERSGNNAVKFSASGLTDVLALYAPYGPIYAKSAGQDTQRCQRTGIYFPVSRIRTDGLGRQVGDRFTFDPPKENPDLPTPY